MCSGFYVHVKCLFSAIVHNQLSWCCLHSNHYPRCTLFYIHCELRAFTRSFVLDSINTFAITSFPDRAIIEIYLSFIISSPINNPVNSSFLLWHATFSETPELGSYWSRSRGKTVRAFLISVIGTAGAACGENFIHVENFQKKTHNLFILAGNLHILLQKCYISCGEKFSPNFCLWRKNYKYEVYVQQAGSKHSQRR